MFKNNDLINFQDLEEKVKYESKQIKENKSLKFFFDHDSESIIDGEIEVLNELADEIIKYHTVNSKFPVFFNPIFRNQGKVNKSIIKFTQYINSFFKSVSEKIKNIEKKIKLTELKEEFSNNYFEEIEKFYKTIENNFTNDEIKYQKYETAIDSLIKIYDIKVINSISIDLYDKNILDILNKNNINNIIFSSIKKQHFDKKLLTEENVIFNFLTKQNSSSIHLFTFFFLMKNIEFSYIFIIFKEIYRILINNGIAIVEFYEINVSNYQFINSLCKFIGFNNIDFIKINNNFNKIGIILNKQTIKIRS